MRLGLILLSATAMMSASASTAAAEVDLSSLPCDRSVISYVEHQPKIPPDYPVERRIGTHRLFIPWAYFLGRPGPWRLNCPQRMDWTSIAFWVPDFQPPERDLSGKRDKRPVESSRPAPGPDEWVLKIIRLEPMRDEDKGLPEMVASSRKYIWSGHQEVPDGTLMRAGEDHWFRLGAEDDVLVRCFPGRDSLCRVILDLKDLRLRIDALYVKSGVHQHDLILAGIRRLIAEWKNKR